MKLKHLISTSLLFTSAICTSFTLSASAQNAILKANNPDSQINLRSAPTTNSRKLGYGLVGDSVTILERSRGSNGYTWYKVRFPRSQAIGWIRGDFINPVTPARRDLVNASQKQDPSVTPFIGSWKDYETIWSIYPSATKGQVCVVRREMNTAVLNMGNVKNGKIHMETGWVISSQGDKLNVAFPDGNIPLTVFGQLKEASELQYVDNSYLVPLLRKYKQAGCTASYPKNNNQY